MAKALGRASICSTYLTDKKYANQQLCQGHKKCHAESKDSNRKQSAGPYVPKYYDAKGKLVEMKKNSAKFMTVAGIRILFFNEESDEGYGIQLGEQMHRNNNYSLRAAIYQTGSSDPELVEVKKQMEEALLEAETRLLRDYLKMQFVLEELKD